MPFTYLLPPPSALIDLLTSPGTVRISPDGTELYLAANNSRIIMIVGEEGVDFNAMSDDDLTVYVMQRAANAGLLPGSAATDAVDAVNAANAAADVPADVPVDPPADVPVDPPVDTTPTDTPPAPRSQLLHGV